MVNGYRIIIIIELKTLWTVYIIIVITKHEKALVDLYCMAL